MATWYFAWVDPEETTFGAEHHVFDEDVFSVRMVEEEAAFPSLTVEVRNPGVGLLNAGRKQWAWVARDGGSGIEALFFGRLIGVPQDLQDEIVRLEFVARPPDYQEQKATIFATYTLPAFDPIWVRDGARDDPDAILEFQPVAWHVDRITHVVTASDITAGEAGTVDVAGEYFYDSLSVRYGPPPVRKVNCEVAVEWDQVSTGELDLSKEIVKAAQAAGGSRGGVISSLTGQGLLSDWPEPGDRIGGNWEVGTSRPIRKDGEIGPTLLTSVTLGILGAVFRIPAYDIKPVFWTRWDVKRRRRETATFTIEADVQAVLADPGEEEVLTVELGSDAVDEPLGDVSSAFPDGELPIGDVSRARYFQTDRGQQSIAAAINICRAKLLFRARTVEIRFETTFDTGAALSCRHNVSIDDDRLPGGTATGKVVSVELSSDNGAELAVVRIACMVGKGNTVSSAAGTPVYAASGYVDDGYQVMSGALVMPVAGEVGFEDFSGQAIDDDGFDFSAMTIAQSVRSVTIINDITTQRDLLAAAAYTDLQEAVNAINSIPTEIEVEMEPISSGPFESVFAITCTDLMVPKTIDLEAA